MNYAIFLQATGLLAFLALAAGEKQNHLDYGRTSETKKLATQADQHFHDGNLQKASDLLGKITDLDPGDVAAWKVRAWVHAYVMASSASTEKEKQRRIDQSLDILQTALKANPKSSELHFELGWTLFDRIGDLQASADSFQKAIGLADAKSKPDKAMCLRMAGHVFEVLPDIRAAIAAYEGASRADPSDTASKSKCSRTSQVLSSNMGGAGKERLHRGPALDQ